MEYMAGGDLQQFLASINYKPLKVPVARKITFQIAQALKYLHQHRIIHRDIKLENIMLTENFNAKLADFGLSEIM